MSLFKYIFLFTTIISYCCFEIYAVPSLKENDTQNVDIKKILENETHIKTYRDIVDIVERIDNIYSNLYDKIKGGKKLVVFVDPAHGKLPDGRWQGGAATRRQSCTDKPEEYYSIIISRELYKRLNANPHIEIKSTPDFLEVMEGKTEIYGNISFKETVELAQAAEAFIIVSEHLNNISVADKADGIMNIPGIHITRNTYGEKLLKLVTGSHKGFLTLYNIFDASGFSKEYAVNIKESLVKKGIKPNSWEQGIVPDNRFTYFSDYPVSVIYESGFISHPDEEKLLGTQEYAAVLADSHYTALIKTLKDVFKVDISGKNVKKIRSPNEQSEHLVELMKMSQIAMYYIKTTKTDKAAAVIKTMEQYPGDSANTAFFTVMKDKIEQAEKLYAKGLAASKNKTKTAQNTKKNKKQAKPVDPDVYFRQANNTLNSIPIYREYKTKYSKAIKKKNIAKTKPKGKKNTIDGNFAYARKAPKLRTILLPIENGQDLKSAIDAALAPDKITLEKLHKSFAKTKAFKSGIYLVTIDDKLTVKKTKRVQSVTLSPDKYQNQQYLKNSFFAQSIVEKSI